MNYSKEDILGVTHYGLSIYSHVLRQYYPDETVLSLSGNACKPAKNPFREHKRTLQISLNNWVFEYSDSEDSSFKGNPFSFAELHYKQSGQELLKTLNSEMNLRLDVKNKFCNTDPEPMVPEQKKTEPIFIPEFSYFNRPITNIHPDKTHSNLVEIYQIIKGEALAESTKALREITDKKQARKYKAQNFDYVTFSGTFSKRNDKALLSHSGLLTIDFDDVQDIEKLRKKLLQDVYFETELLFTSPSGNGLKWVITIDLTQVSHAEYFQAVSNYILNAYQIEPDKSGKDISRACFLSHDKQVYINPKYLQQ